jgi:hypothetical protein
MDRPTGFAWTLVVVLVVLAAITPALVALSNALLPVVVAGGVMFITARLVWHHTRKW